VKSVADFKKQWGVNPTTTRKKDLTAMVPERWPQPSGAPVNKLSVNFAASF
jgi:hypothetical protein